MNITWTGCAEGNYEVGRGGHKPEGLVIHLMAGSLAGTDAWFNTTPENRGQPPSSAHYGIGKTGSVHQYVKDEDRAYHAGRVQNPTWPMVAEHAGINPNAWTIGIEHEGQVDDDWTEEMIQASAELIADLCIRWIIPCDRAHIAKHHEVYAPKPCPGPKCPIDALVLEAQRIQTARSAA